jgi:hypothetical protein
MKTTLIAASCLIAAGAAAAQTEWTDHPSSPVLTLPTGVEAYGPVVVQKGSTYHAYYTRKAGASETIDHMTSDDGITWGARDTTILTASGDAARFDKVKVGQPSIIVEGDTLKMWFWGAGAGVGSIGYAWSTDGMAWTKVDGPLTNKSVFDIAAAGGSPVAIATPCVIKDGAGYKMWFARLSVVGSAISYVIGGATSPDGLAWTVMAGSGAGGAVLEAGAAGKFDSAGAFFPSVVKDGSTYRMWYSGQADDSAQIGYATSSDGIVWTKVAGTLAHGGMINGQTCSVMMKDGGYSMYYVGETGVNLATSGVSVVSARAGRSWPGLHPIGLRVDALGKRVPANRDGTVRFFGLNHP